MTTLQNALGWTQNGLSNAFSTFGWVPTPSNSSAGEYGALNSTVNQGTATITNISITSNVVAVTVSTMTQSFSPGQTIQFSAVGTNTFLNGVILIVQSSPAPTTTTFSATSAAFSHANVGSGADTGTITAFTNWNTVSALPDVVPTTTNAQQNPGWYAQYKYRGPWQNTTTTFTNLQRTNNTVIITVANNTIPSFAVGSALFITGVASANFSTTNSPTQINLNTNPGSTTLPPGQGWPILAVTATTITINTLSQPGNDIGSTGVAAGTGTVQYFGTNSVTSTSINTCDIVTYNGDVYIYANTTVYTSSPTAPGTNTSNWKRIWYEMWCSADALSSTNRLFLKFVYASFNNSPNTPVLVPTFGTASDGNGNLTQNYSANGVVQNQITTGLPATVLPTTSPSTLPVTGTALWESDFSGASGRFTCIMWRGYTVTANTPALIINIERSHDTSGNDTDAYWTILFQCVQGTGFATWQQSVFKSGTGGLGVWQPSTAQQGCIYTLTTILSQTTNNSIPFLPCFPMVGFVGNPFINVIAMKAADCFEGGLLTATFYGTNHPYLMSKVGGTTSGGPSAFGMGISGNAVGIRWE